MKKIFVFAAVLFSILACEGDGLQYDVKKGHVVLSADISGDDTKTVLDGSKFSWADTDVVGVFIDQEKAIKNASFKVSEISSNGKTANFVSENELAVDISEEEKQAYAYYPFRSSFSSSNLTFVIPYLQEQTDREATHLANYDYMVAPPVAWTSTLPSLRFHHVVAKMDFEFINEHSQELTVRQISLSAKDTVFYTSASVNLYDQEPKLSFASASTIESVGVSLASGIAKVEPFGTLSASMMMFPIDLRDKEITITVTTVERGDFVYVKSGRNFLAGNRYHTILSLKERLLTLSTDTISFGKDQTEAQFTLKSVNGSTAVTMKTDQPWLIVEPTELLVPEYTDQSSIQTVNVRLDSDGLPGGTSNAHITVSHDGVDEIINVTVERAGTTEVRSFSPNFVVELVGCHEELDVLYIDFKIKNRSEVNKTVDPKRSYSLYLYNNIVDNCGNQYTVDKYIWNGEEFSNSRHTLQPSETANCTYMINRFSSTASELSWLSINAYDPSYGNLNTHITCKNIKIDGRTTPVLPQAQDVAEISMSDDRLTFKILSTYSYLNKMYVKFRITNNYAATKVLNFNGPTVIYDKTGHRFSIDQFNCGMSTSLGGDKILPPNTFLQGSMTISGISETLSSIDYAYFGQHIKNYDMQDNLIAESDNFMLLKNLQIQDRKYEEESLPEPTTTCGSIESHVSDIDCEVTGCESLNGKTRVHLRLKNKSKGIIQRRIMANYSNPVQTYAVDEHGIIYYATNVFFGYDSNTGYQSSYLAPDHYCNAYVDFVQVGSESTILRYVRIQFGTDEGYIALRDVAIEGVEYIEPEETITTTCESITSCSSDLEFKVTGCKSDEEEFKLYFTVNNKTKEELPLILYTSNRLESFACDNHSNYLPVSLVQLGGTNSTDHIEVRLAPSVPIKGCITIKNEDSKADVLQSVYLYTNSYNSILKGELVFTGVKIEGRSHVDVPEPKPVECKISHSYSGLGFSIDECRANAEGVSLALRIKNTTNTIKRVSVRRKYTEEFFFNCDRNGFWCPSTITMAGRSGNTPETYLLPGTSTVAYMNVPGVSEEASLFEYVDANIYVANNSSDYDTGKRLVIEDLPIEGRTQSAQPLPEPLEGVAESESCDFKYRILSCKVEEGSLIVNFRVENTTQYVRTFAYAAKDYESFLYDELGNYYQLSSIKMGIYTYSSSSFGCIFMGPGQTVDGTFTVDGYDEASGIVKHFCLHVGKNKVISNDDPLEKGHFIVKDIPIEGREASSVEFTPLECKITNPFPSVKYYIKDCYIDDYNNLIVDMYLENTSSNIAYFYALGYSKYFYDNAGKYYSMYPNYYYFHLPSGVLRHYIMKSSSSFNPEVLTGDTVPKITLENRIGVGYSANYSSYTTIFENVPLRK